MLRSGDILAVQKDPGIKRRDRHLMMLFRKNNRKAMLSFDVAIELTKGCGILL